MKPQINTIKKYIDYHKECLAGNDGDYKKLNKMNKNIVSFIFRNGMKNYIPFTRMFFFSSGYWNKGTLNRFMEAVEKKFNYSKALKLNKLERILRKVK